ncbi:hypothetical protein GUJ93_ZPchr0305g33726 [Zizania palustris]|uniref:RING-type E3 ubiquitin transferase n=1 Tax=Zizania palustris TaxID=103762 RepID=A0A8J5UZB5_ZIZPA|nr:hypothetical protein GUJ93_ZPchr0305g33726 [Zizania palustris]
MTTWEEDGQSAAFSSPRGARFFSSEKTVLATSPPLAALAMGAAASIWLAKTGKRTGQQQQQQQLLPRKQQKPLGDHKFSGNPAARGRLLREALVLTASAAGTHQAPVAKTATGQEESSPSSPNGLCSASSSSSSGSSRSVSRPSRRAASRVGKADEGASAGAGSVHRDTSGDARRSSDRGVDDFLLVEQAARDQVHTEGFLSGFLARYRSDHQGGLSSLEDNMEDANGYWRFDVEGTGELQNYFIFNDRHRGMRMDIDGMSYEELLALGERIGTVSTGLSEDALSKCLNRSMYTPTTPGTDEDCDRKCSICQEEYSDGEEVGKMACKHYYHISCIQNWLVQKNWCPICKSVALNTN